MRSLLRHPRLLLALVGLCLPAALGVAAPAPSSPADASSALTEMMLPVPTVTIYPGDTIKETMLRLQPYPTTYRARAAVIDAPMAIVGRTARRMLLPGEPVPVNAVDDPASSAAARRPR